MRPNTTDQKKSNSFHIEFKIFVRHFTLKFDFFEIWDSAVFGLYLSWIPGFLGFLNSTNEKWIWIDCNASKINRTDTKPGPISWDWNIQNQNFNFCVGVWVGGHLLVKSWILLRKSIKLRPSESPGFRDNLFQISQTGNCFIKYPYLIITPWYRLYIIDSGPFQWVNEEMEYG